MPKTKYYYEKRLNGLSHLVVGHLKVAVDCVLYEIEVRRIALVEGMLRRIEREAVVRVVVFLIVADALCAVLSRLLDEESAPIARRGRGVHRNEAEDGFVVLVELARGSVPIVRGGAVDLVGEQFHGVMDLLITIFEFFVSTQIYE